ncbi:MAG: sigma-70 family RNA polymerase sigma factor [Planctomycetes bacterium]|nr:sigma-70 family RNA polymerase sigma factor [Planctomycetota bacterium]
MTEARTSTVLSRYRSGDLAQFQELHARISPRLYLWCALRVPKALRHRIDPDDLLQEIWLRVMALLPRYQRERASFRHWVFGVAANVLAEQLRRCHVRQREAQADASAVFADLPAAATGVVQRAVRSEELRLLLGSIQQLPPEEQRLVLLRGLEGRPHQEVGVELGIGDKAAEMRWRRVCERLRQRWAAAGLGESVD